MGSFSWNKADDLTEIENIVIGKSFKFLIPKEFGGGFIKDKYRDYGELGVKKDGRTPKYDMYELIAFWNDAKGLRYDGKKPLMKETDEYTDHNRRLGVSIGCEDYEILKLKYPLKLVSPSYKGTYEDLKTCSLGDPDQGCARKRKKKGKGKTHNLPKADIKFILFHRETEKEFELPSLGICEEYSHLSFTVVNSYFDEELYFEEDNQGINGIGRLPSYPGDDTADTYDVFIEINGVRHIYDGLFYQKGQDSKRDYSN